MIRFLSISLFAIALAAAACGSGNDDGSGTPADVTVEPGDDTVEPGDDTVEPRDDTVEPGDDTVPADPNPPEVSLTLTRYAAISGIIDLDCSWSDDVEVVKVEVLIDGEPVGELDLDTRATFDTTVVPPGAHGLSLRASDAAGNTTETEAIHAIFAGKGEFLQFEDAWFDGILPGWAGFSLVIPEAGEVDHQKGHVTVPDGTGEVRGYLYWKSQHDWEFTLDIGTGTCPHSGVLLATEQHKAHEWLLEVIYTDPAGAPGGAWFAHVDPMDYTDHGGESIQLDLIMLVVPKH